VFTSKLDVLKATLKNEGRIYFIDDLEKRKNLMLQHLDTTKFYRISGLMGSRDTISYVKTSIKEKTGVNIE
jgi:hypothetical protein